MQLHINIGNHNLTALIESGSTHNFDSAEAAKSVGIHFQDSHGINVTVANGDCVACRGLARDVPINFGEEYFSVDCYTIPPLDCYDVVLGVSFLHTLGPILWDFDYLCMAFWHHGHCVLWKGVGSTHWDITSPSRFYTINTTDPPLLDRLLDSFQDFFQPPMSPPPPRSCDHRIHLLPNTSPLAVRPYRYPQLQKDERVSECNNARARHHSTEHITLFGSGSPRQET